MGVYESRQYYGIRGIDNFICFRERIIMADRDCLNSITRNNYLRIINGLSLSTIVKRMPPFITISKIFP